MPDPQVACNVPFLQSVDLSIFVQNCNNITAADKTRAGRVGRAQAQILAKQRCPDECPNTVFIRDNVVIIRGCTNQNLDFTYEGFFKCVPAKKKGGRKPKARARTKTVRRQRRTPKAGRRRTAGKTARRPARKRTAARRSRR